MPEVVQSWVYNKSIDEVENIQSQIILGYENDFARRAPTHYYPKLSAVWNAIPSQLAKENRKFIYSQVKKSWRAKDLEYALEWLIRAGLVYKIESIDKPGLPLSAYANHTYFKLYMTDVGILRRLANLPASVVLDKSDKYTEFKGAMAENFVCCELKRLYEQSIYYWTAQGTGRAEVDFIIQYGADVVPIEVKAGTASHARSLKQYCVKYSPKKSVLTSMDHTKHNILPIYAFWKFADWIA
jgi:predicted AAA+ superfamily ATPase